MLARHSGQSGGLAIAQGGLLSTADAVEALGKPYQGGGIKGVAPVGERLQDFDYADEVT
ncbi:hypothetical protein D3C72_2425010 [compost metagenome]